MAHIRLLNTNRMADTAATLTASSAASALPADAAVNPDRSYVWRSATDTTVQTLDIDLGSVLAVTAVALANVRLLGSGVIELYERGDGSSPGSSTLVATLPAQDRDTRTTFAFFASQSHRHWQLKWTNPGSDSDYAELGFGFLGTYLEPTRNVRVPARVSRVDPSIGTMAVSGQKTFVERPKYFAGAWEFIEIAEAQLDDFRSLWDTIGAREPIFMVLDTDLAWTCWLARFVGELGAELGVIAGRYTVTFPWEEVR